MIYSLEDKKPSFEGTCFIADSATLIGSVVLGDYVNVWFNAVLRADTDLLTVGENSNIQDGSVLHMDKGFPLTIGRNVTIGHKVMLHGCTIGDSSLVGMNAVVLNGAKIGKNCLIGANALVPEGREIPDSSVVLGSPGKIVREVTSSEIESFQSSAKAYVQKGRLFKKSLKPQS